MPDVEQPIEPPRTYADPASEPDPDEASPEPFHSLTRRHTGIALALVLTLLITAVAPPFINMSRYKRQISSSIGSSLGRPVHIDNVTLDLLPMPGFTLENFVVGEDPAFGSEPVIRANTVRATLRVSSLWRRRVEFSKISLDNPSLNLVHLPDGRWNLVSILLQASRMPAAPTAQHTAGPAQRFPYIQATGARVNLKLGLEKTPISLTDADFALWLPEPERWHLRLEAHPARTDTATTDTGLLRAEGTLGRAATLNTVPVDLKGTWTAAPLGAVSRLISGRDLGFRGTMNLRAQVQGTMGVNQLESHLAITDLRRADFVPAHMLDAEIACQAALTDVFHAVTHVRCSWPADSVSTGLTLTGALPDLRQPATAALTATLKDVPAAGLLEALRMISSRVDPGLALTGRIDGQLLCCGAGTEPLDAVSGQGQVQGLLLRSKAEPAFLDAPVTQASVTAGALTAGPFPLALGGHEPAMLTIGASPGGMSMHLTGTLLRSRLLQLAAALPQLGDGLREALPPPVISAVEAPIRLDLVSTRTWNDGQVGGQTWTPAVPVKEKLSRRAARSHKR